jgi:hypothetical protein
MESLNHLTIKIILENLSFDDILRLLWTPKWRNIMLDYYSMEMNMKDLIKVGLLEIFDNLVRKVGKIDISDDIHDFLTTQGMVPYYKEKEMEEKKFGFFCLFTREEITNAFPSLPTLDMKRSFLETVIEDEDPVAYIYRILKNITSVNKSTRQRKDYISDRVDMLIQYIDWFLVQHTADYLEVFFYDPKLGFRNTLLLFEKLSETTPLQEYCVNKPCRLLNFLEKIFVKS